MSAAFHPAVSLSIFLLIMAPFAMTVVGIVSLLVHPRRRPRSYGEWVLWACRGVAYAMGALLAAMLGVNALLGRDPASVFAAVIIAFALVALRMRHEHHGTGGENGAA